ncbi:hypothetical protein V6N13_042908 [Hibiscus sabdariffa]
MCVLSWNVRGLGSSVKRSAIRKVLRQQRIKMVFLVETKLEVVSEVVVKSLWWIDSYSFLVSASEGLLGGIIIIWDVEERRQCVGDKRVMVGFASFMGEVGLLDIPVAGKAFTWFEAGLKASRLDQFLVSPACVE